MERCLALLDRRGRVSHTALRLEFGLDDETLGALRDELVDVLGVADDDGRVLTRRGTACPDPPPAAAPGEGDAVATDVGEQVTVLLCDLATTPATEALDREALDVVISRVQSICHEVARRLDGHHQPWISDGVAIFFGHTHAHDDDAVRAVRCGWEIQRAIGAARDVIDREFGVAVSVRIGIATGMSRAGDTDAGGGDAPNPFGDTPNMASRVQAIGDPGAVVIDAATHALAHMRFEFEELGLHELTGCARPVGLFRLTEPRGAGGRVDARVEPVPTALVGRTSERALLRALAERAVGGTRSAVLLRGEAGNGKTRLIRALRATAEHELEMRALVCACSPYHRGSPLHPIVEGLRRLWALDGPDAAAHLAGPIAERTGLAGDDRAIVLLAGLLGLGAPPASAPLAPMSPRRERRETLAALGRALAAEAGAQPLLVVIEDLHWADATTLEFVGALLDGPHDLPLLLAMSSRPEFRPAWNATLQRLELGRMSRAETLRIIGLVASDTVLPDGDLEELASRAEGVPLLAEELARAVLATQDDHDAVVPMTLFGCLMARLDRDSTERAVAQLAATIGREFPHALLAAQEGTDESALQWGLERLVADEVVVPTGEGTYAFQHALLGDAARSSLRRRQRRDHDRRIARALLTHFPDVAAAQPERVARHFEYAGEMVEAVAHWQRAGLHALRQAAYREASAHFERGLTLVSRLPDGDRRASIELTLRVLACLPITATHGWGSSAFEAHHARAEVLARRVEGTPKLFTTMLGLVSDRMMRGHVEEAVALARNQIAVADAVGDPDLVLEAECVVGAGLVHLGRHRDALAHLTRTADLYDPALHHKHAGRYGRNPAAVALTYRAVALACRDDRDGTRAAIKAARSVLRATPHPFSDAWARCGAATVAVIYDERDAVLRESEAVIEIATQEELPDWLAMANVLHGWARVRAGDREALDEVQGGIARWSHRGAILMRPFLLGLYADASREAGEPETGLQAIREALDSGMLSERWSEPELHRLHAELLLANGDRYGARGAARRAVALARRTGAAAWERRAAATLTRVGDRSGVPQ
ncbi:MAG: hypothetical protein QOG15_2367 [Solirubrobacteraceae bacterium]|nr:hypothetical protein [Solirubrobacteraceae bacterium]